MVDYFDEFERKDEVKKYRKKIKQFVEDNPDYVKYVAYYLFRNVLRHKHYNDVLKNTYEESANLLKSDSEIARDVLDDIL